MPDRNDYNRNKMNAIERDRMERRRQLRRKSMISNALVIGVVAVVVIGIIAAVIVLTGKNKQPQTADPTTVTATIASSAQQKETTKPKATVSDVSSQSAGISSQDDDVYSYEDNDTSSSAASSLPSSDSAVPSSSGSVSGGGSNTLHATAYGQTSYGYDWTYDGGGGIVSISCDYDFDSHMYNFSVTGISEGVTTLTLYYNTDDGVQQPINMTVSVDSNLNVTQIG